MLSRFLTKADCAACRFCCSFRRTSLWEVPIFTKENIDALSASHPEYLKELRTFEAECSVYAKYDLSGKYVTHNPEEEVPCPFLDPARGCVLTEEEKPWDCKIWPLRVVRRSDGSAAVCLTPTCPTINKLDIDNILESLEEELLLYAEKHPLLYKNDYFKHFTPPQ